MFGAQFVDTTPLVPVAEAKPQEVAKPAPVALVSPVSPTPTPNPPGALSSLAQYTPEQKKENLTSPFDINKNISMFVVGGLMIVMTVDGVVVLKRKIPRRGGRFLAHFSFLAMVLIIVIVARAGNIL